MYHPSAIWVPSECHLSTIRVPSEGPTWHSPPTNGSRTGSQVCKEYNLPGNSVVFAASVRFAERQIAVLDRLLDALPDSQVSASESISSASESISSACESISSASGMHLSPS